MLCFRFKFKFSATILLYVSDWNELSNKHKPSAYNSDYGNLIKFVISLVCCKFGHILKSSRDLIFIALENKRTFNFKVYFCCHVFGGITKKNVIIVDLTAGNAKV